MNPKLQIFPVNYVNDPRVIGQNDNVVSVNSALSVDLIGQVAADSISADVIFSGAGGFVDFVRGASFSKGGKSIIAMPSTAMGGKASRIVDQFEAGRPVTLSRFETHYVVTEYGIAQLRGKPSASGPGPSSRSPTRTSGTASKKLTSGSSKRHIERKHTPFPQHPGLEKGCVSDLFSWKVCQFSLQVLIEPTHMQAVHQGMVAEKRDRQKDPLPLPPVFAPGDAGVGVRREGVGWTMAS